jgi:hypothetical protein
LIEHDISPEAGSQLLFADDFDGEKGEIIIIIKSESKESYGRLSD